jgi:phage gp36-like protein
MAYAAVQDMIGAFGEAEITRLAASDGDLTVLNVAKVETALGTASGFIDSHLRRRYACPLATVPPEIMRACLVLARYDLSFGGDTEPSEQVRLARKEAVDWLVRLNAGSVTLEGVELNSALIGARTQDRPRIEQVRGLYQGACGLGWGFW